ncbi:MAG: PepSY-like domain-containing protein [Rikenella sp.]|nr:PepSY-like domain-containing protein [Rikenella sp.]
MKKLILSLLVGFALYATACADSKPVVIRTADLPASAQNFLKKHFSTLTVNQVTVENKLFGKEYEVKLAGGAEIEFDKNGDWTKIDCQRNALPETAVPAKILEYVKQNHPNHFVSSIEREDDGEYDVEIRDLQLDHEMDLVFDSRYDFLRID